LGEFDIFALSPENLLEQQDICQKTRYGRGGSGERETLCCNVSHNQVGGMIDFHRQRNAVGLSRIIRT
jgi:hypothetical protein